MPIHQLDNPTNLLISSVFLSRSGTAPLLPGRSSPSPYQNKRSSRLPLDRLIALSRLRTKRRLAIADHVPSLQKTEHDARRTIEKRAEAGLVEAHGSGRGRTHTLCAKIYRKQGQKAYSIRQAGFDQIQ